jgi:hypothetical protein
MTDILNTIKEEITNEVQKSEEKYFTPRQTVLGKQTGGQFIVARPEKVETTLETLENIRKNLVVTGSDELKHEIDRINSLEGVENYGYQVSTSLFSKDFGDIFTVISEIEKELRQGMDNVNKYSKGDNNQTFGDKVKSIGNKALAIIYGSATVVPVAAATIPVAIMDPIGTAGVVVGTAVAVSGAAIATVLPWVSPEAAWDYIKGKYVNEKEKPSYDKQWESNGPAEQDNWLHTKITDAKDKVNEILNKPKDVEENGQDYHKPGYDENGQDYHKPGYINENGEINTGTSKGGEQQAKIAGYINENGKINTGTSKGGEQQAKIERYIDENGRIRRIEDEGNWTDLIPDDMKNKTENPNLLPKMKNALFGNEEEDHSDMLPKMRDALENNDSPSGGEGYTGGNETETVIETPTVPQTVAPTVPPTVAPTVPPTGDERPTEVITQPVTETPTVPTTTTPGPTPQPNQQPSGGGTNGGGNYSYNNTQSTTPQTTPSTTVKLDEDVIKKGNTYKLPTSSKPTTTTTTTTTTTGNSVIPVLAGLGAAAAAGIGAKTYIDRKNNRDNDEEPSDFKAEDWSNNTEVNVEYQEPVQEKEETLDFDDDGYAVEEPERYGARTSQDLEDLQ